MCEKLIGLYREAHKKAHKHCNNVRCDKCEYEHFGSNCIRIAKADHLIANGVTIPVRCKDCKHFVQGEPYDPCECMKWTVKFGVAYTTPDGYCHKAERKDNG